MQYQRKGFTLIELMVAIAVLGIVLGIAIPAFRTQILNNHSVAMAEELVTAINYARSEAVKRGRRVSICASSDGESCVGQWTEGWIVFVDGAVSDFVSPPVITTPATDILKIWPAPYKDSEIVEANGKAFIRFTSMGILGRVDANTVSINTEMDGCVGQAARLITVNFAGAVNVSRIECVDN